MDLLSPARISLMKVDRRKWNSIAKVCYMMLVKIELMIVENRMKNWFHRIIKIRWYNRWEYDLLWLWIERNKFLHTRYFELWKIFSLNIVKLKSNLIVKLKSDFSLIQFESSESKFFEIWLKRIFLRYDYLNHNQKLNEKLLSSECEKYSKRANTAKMKSLWTVMKIQTRWL